MFGDRWGRWGCDALGAAVYYIRMVQPKTPPISFRPPANLLQAAEAWGAARGLTRHAAFIELMRRGLDAPEKVKVSLPVGAERPAYGSRLKKR